MTKRVSIRRGGKDLGTFPLGKIKLLIASGDLLESDLARFEGAGEWQELGEVDMPIGPRTIVITVVISILVVSGVGVLLVKLGPIFPFALMGALCLWVFLSQRKKRHKEQVSRSAGHAAAMVSIETVEDKLAMGGRFEGQVVLTANSPLRACQSELSLTLFVRVYVESSGEGSKGRYEWVTWGSCEDLVPKKPVDLLTDETSSSSFSMIAPSHGPGSSESKWAIFSTDESKTRRMSTEELLRKRMVKWVAKVRVRGVPGILECEIEPRVEDANYQRSRVREGREAGGRLLGNVVLWVVGLPLFILLVVGLFKLLAFFSSI
jgi:hypothetical protein